MQDAVAAAGPLLTLLGFVVFPILWSVPEALITAELATAFPENSGYVAWVTAAFGPFWGFQVSGACCVPQCASALHGVLTMPHCPLRSCDECTCMQLHPADAFAH